MSRTSNNERYGYNLPGHKTQGSRGQGKSGKNWKMRAVRESQGILQKWAESGKSQGKSQCSVIFSHMNCTSGVEVNEAEIILGMRFTREN